VPSPHLDIVLEIHAEAIAQFGGSDGLRDRALLESAIAAPNPPSPLLKRALEVILLLPM
jgi:hypothetical protein